ncbi:BZ3500_MvSof-1268-A1-R1_Chr2-1g04084 [Microbotryum saponariae]|uniref:BZ3500_MvSof-1268-A1-R1_Chr2-1g04084 protein n=1 Tax=Microbotryum saponariae TaxID=289078 RepID=A0A2X0KXK0_9BASI|nr:BZ3500_MvSof-1268-A1-R1_Chr2-1g04084 [Microbotryum saponariae]SCZ91071.1 BZ3501_MvSof-1269-A2-R1_Chr2-1g03740 [Microbotryum saponariae]
MFLEAWLPPTAPTTIEECFISVREDGTVRFDTAKAIKFSVFVSTIVFLLTMQFFIETFRFISGLILSVVGLVAFLYIPLPPDCRDDPLWIYRLLQAAYLPTAGYLAGFGEALLIWFRKSTFDRAAARAGVAAADLDKLEIMFILFTAFGNLMIGTGALFVATYAVYLLVTRYTSIRDRLRVRVVDEESQLLITNDAADKTPDALNSAIDDDDHSDANAAMNDHHNLHASTDHTPHAGNFERPASGCLDFTAAASLGGHGLEGCDKRA